MCFYLENRDDKPKVAKRNIVCYKSMYKGMMSLHYGYQYRKGRVEATEIGKVDRSSCSPVINEGFHSYIAKKSARPRSRHSVIFSAYRCIIPKGSLYYVNCNSGEYISNQIIIKRELWW